MLDSPQRLFAKKEKAENGDVVEVNKEYGVWATSSTVDLLNAVNHPLYNVVKVDLDNLSLYDYYAMKDYYQIKTSLSIISFTLMSINWWIKGGTQEINDAVTFQVSQIWGQLMKNITKAYWAGYSPNVKVFDMHPTKKLLYIKKLRDLSPFMCEPMLDPKDQTFNGFLQKSGSFKRWEVRNGVEIGQDITIPASEIDPKYAFWYVFLMENGDYKGQKLLKGAYSPWFFSQVMHLYENRYFQRFSTPVVVGTAPSEYVQDSEGNEINGQQIMATILSEIRNNSSISLPSELDENGSKKWDVKLLESTQRGFDFEGYLKRLDMEMARAVFLPDLIFNSGRVGSYKLGQVQKDTFLMLLNALMNDLKFYVDNYIIKQFVEYNFPKSRRNFEIPVLEYEKQGTNSMSVIMELILELTKKGKVDADLDEIAKIIGVPISKLEVPEESQPAVQTQPNTEEQPENTENNSNEVVTRLATHAIDSIVRVSEKNALSDTPRTHENIKVEGILGEVSAISSIQATAIQNALAQNNNKIKLSYRGKIDKIWRKMTGSCENVFSGAENVVEGYLNEIEGKKVMASMVVRDLYNRLLSYYLSDLVAKNEEIKWEIAEELDKLIR